MGNKNFINLRVRMAVEDCGKQRITFSDFKSEMDAGNISLLNNGRINFLQLGNKIIGVIEEIENNNIDLT